MGGAVTLVDQLRERAGEYELRGRAYAERAEADVSYVASADACIAIAIVLRELAAIVDDEELAA